jgi:hypothetical protein
VQMSFALYLFELVRRRPKHPIKEREQPTLQYLWQLTPDAALARASGTKSLAPHGYKSVILVNPRLCAGGVPKSIFLWRSLITFYYSSSSFPPSFFSADDDDDDDDDTKNNI